MKDNLGYVHVYCGDGKGKTTTAMGLCTRAAGYGYKVLIYQFMKNNKTSERKILQQIPNITFVDGLEQEKFSFQMTISEKLERKTYYEKQFRKITAKAAEENYDLLFFDELIYTIRAGLFDEQILLDYLKKPIAILNKKGEQKAEKYFWFDNEKIAALAAEFLLANGHEKIAYLSAPLSEETARTRIAGVKNTIARHNKIFPLSHFSEGTRDIDGGYSACKDLLRKTKDFTGLLCFNDAMALGAVKYLSEIDEIAQGDIAIVGMGADPLINKIYPSLVTVYTPLRELIANAVSYVLGENSDVLENELPGTLYIDERLQKHCSHKQYPMWLQNAYQSSL